MTATSDYHRGAEHALRDLWMHLESMAGEAARDGRRRDYRLGLEQAAREARQRHAETVRERRRVQGEESAAALKERREQSYGA